MAGPPPPCFLKTALTMIPAAQPMMSRIQGPVTIPRCFLSGVCLCGGVFLYIHIYRCSLPSFFICQIQTRDLTPKLAPLFVTCHLISWVGEGVLNRKIKAKYFKRIKIFLSTWGSLLIWDLGQFVISVPPPPKSCRGRGWGGGGCALGRYQNVSPGPLSASASRTPMRVVHARTPGRHTILWLSVLEGIYENK